jgi:4-hydroxybenzoate polyprenyltransferase
LLAVCAGAVLCDLKDAARDRAARVRSLPVMLGEWGASITSALLALGALAIAVMAGAWGLVACAAAMATLSALPALVRRPVLGPLTVDTALAIPGAVLFALQ